jgi:hypothetical protein
MIRAKEILDAVREMSAEKLSWEDNRRHPGCSIVPSLNGALGGSHKKYPSGTCMGKNGKRPADCDCVFGRHWIEVKGAWTCSDWAGVRRNQPFKKHLLTDAYESALIDVRKKLPTLMGHCEVETIGFLLVCFWSDRFPFPSTALKQLINDGKLREGWRRSKTPRWRPAGTELWVKCYYWERSANSKQIANGTG